MATDAGMSTLGAGCSQLQNIDLAICDEVTDVGISALGAGCGQLQSVNLEHCDLVTIVLARARRFNVTFNDYTKQLCIPFAVL